MKTKAYVCVCLFNTFIPLNYCKLIGFDTNYLHLLIHLFFSAKELIVVLRERGREREREREEEDKQRGIFMHSNQLNMEHHKESSAGCVLRIPGGLF